jgi:hypothetical protein
MARLPCPHSRSNLLSVSRVAISNNRLLSMDDRAVRFRWKDYRDGNHQKTMTLDANEFIRRFLIHVLPDGFHRIRYFGFLGNCHRAQKVARCRELLGMVPPQPAADPPADHRDRFEALPPARRSAQSTATVGGRCADAGGPAGSVSGVAGQPALRPREQRDGGSPRCGAGAARLCRRAPGG